MKTTIKNHIRRLRFERNEMSQQQLAERVGVTRQTINAIELGKHPPSLDLAYLIADEFGVAIEAVFYRPSAGDPGADKDETVVPLGRKASRKAGRKRA